MMIVWVKGIKFILLASFFDMLKVVKGPFLEGPEKFSHTESYRNWISKLFPYSWFERRFPLYKKFQSIYLSVFR